MRESAMGTPWFRTVAAAGVIAASVVAAPVSAQQEDDCNCDRVAGTWGGVGVFGARPMLGVSLDMALDRDLEDRGVRVASVMDDGPADQAGITEGDIILSVAGHDLGEPLDERTERRFDDDQSFPAQRLIAVARDLEEGEPIEVVVDRDGESMNVTVTPEALHGWGLQTLVGPEFGVRLRDLGHQLRDRDWQFDWRRNDDFDVPPVEFRSPDDAVFSLVTGRVHGLELVELNPGLGAYFGTESGVLVADVDEDSELGLQPGDVVVDVDGREIDDGAELRRVLRSYRDGDEIEMRIWRDGRETVVAGVIE